MSGARPRGWSAATVKDLTDVVTSGSRGWARYYSNDGALFIRVGNLKRGTISLDLSETIHVQVPRGAEGERTRLRPGDILVSITADVGMVAVVPDGFKECYVNQHVALLRTSAPMNARLFAYSLLDPTGFQDLVRRIQYGATKTGLNLNQLRGCVLPIPPHAEQSRIVDAIETQLTRLDAAVAALERVQANLKRYRASVLKAAVEGRLVPTEAELARREGRDYEPASALIARTPSPPRPNRWNSRSKDTIAGHAALAVGPVDAVLPEGWSWAPLVDIARMESGHTPSREHPEWWDGEVPWIGIADARAHNGGTITRTVQHTNRDGLANSAARLLPAGTVCVSRTASVGYVVVMGCEMATSQDFVNWIPTSAVTSDWLKIVFSADREALQGFGKGSVHKTIYFPEWLAVQIAVPPKAEQERIAAEVGSRLSTANEVDAALAATRQRCQRLRQSILKWAFEGKLVDQDPNDEPASVLLERIRAERAADGAAKPARPHTVRSKKRAPDAPRRRRARAAGV